MHFQLNDMATFDFTADIGNQEAVDPKLPETNTNNLELQDIKLTKYK